MVMMDLLTRPSSSSTRIHSVTLLSLETELLLLYSSLTHVVQTVLHKDIRFRIMLLDLRDLTTLQTRVHFTALDWELLLILSKQYNMVMLEHH